MGTLHLVRHGQASFGAADYDQLSELGHRQCQALGAHWARLGRRFDAVLIGTQRRHRQSFEAIVQGHAATATAATQPATGEPTPWPEPVTWPGLNEYDFEAIVRAMVDGPIDRSPDPAVYRRHFRLLREGLLGWMEGRLQPEGLPPHAEFLHGVVSALDHLRAHHVGQAVLIVSSGGPISHAVGHLLQVPASGVVELNLSLRNSAVTEFAFGEKRHQLVSFNALPHLESPGHRDWVTHA